MSRISARLLPALLLGAAAIAASPVQAPAPAAAASGTQRAGLVIDTGSEIRHVCVRFDGTISADELLRRANVDAVMRPFSGMGNAVCSLCGVGCPADDSCLRCRAPNYWIYSRAPVGATSFTRASAGPSSVQVQDGDVEGWRWGVGGAPPYASITQICGSASGPPGSVTVTTVAAGGPPPAQGGPAPPAQPHGHTDAPAPAPLPGPASPPGVGPVDHTGDGGAAGDGTGPREGDPAAGGPGADAGGTPDGEVADPAASVMAGQAAARLGQDDAAGAAGGGSVGALAVTGAVVAGLLAASWITWRRRRLGT